MIGGVTTFIALGVLVTLLADVAALLLDPCQSRPARWRWWRADSLWRHDRTLRHLF